jgi:hypothetical protein|nr:MAG TPA: hypothetical protein [Caudoviricetes sp.]
MTRTVEPITKALLGEPKAVDFTAYGLPDVFAALYKEQIRHDSGETETRYFAYVNPARFNLTDAHYWSNEENCRYFADLEDSRKAFYFNFNEACRADEVYKAFAEQYALYKGIAL